MGEIRVSQREYSELLALKAKLEGGEAEKKTGAEVAGDALSFGKKAAVAYLAAGALLFAIGAACILPWMFRGFAQLDAQNSQVRARVERSMPEQLAQDARARSLQAMANDALARTGQPPLTDREVGINPDTGHWQPN